MNGQDFYVYILASGRNGTLYIGMTDNLGERMGQHKSKTYGGFTAKYNVDLLVWYDCFPSRHEAFVRERQMKRWRRAWKIRLIENMNPEWEDLTHTLT